MDILARMRNANICHHTALSHLRRIENATSGQLSQEAVSAIKQAREAHRELLQIIGVLHEQRKAASQAVEHLIEEGVNGE